MDWAWGTPVHTLELSFLSQKSGIPVQLLPRSPFPIRHHPGALTGARILDSGGVWGELCSSSSSACGLDCLPLPKGSHALLAQNIVSSLWQTNTMLTKFCFLQARWLMCMESLSKIYGGPHIKLDRFYDLGDEKGGPYQWQAILLATPPKTVLLTKVLKSSRNGEGRILLAPTSRQLGGSSFSSSLTKVAVEPVPRCLPESNLTACGTPGEINENLNERKIRIQ